MKLQLNGLVYTTDNQSKIDRLIGLGAKEIKVPAKETETIEEVEVIEEEIAKEIKVPAKEVKKETKKKK